MFAEHGYAKTSIRKIALAAEANVAAISYYFGNKAGLYRAVFWGAPGPEATPGTAATVARADRAVVSLAGLFEHILKPLKSGEMARYWIKLQRREMLEPTGLWREKVDRGMQPAHAALVALLCERLGLAKPDAEVEALAVMVIAPAVHLLVNCEVVDALAPQLLADEGAVDAWQARLLRAAEAMIEAERKRRHGMASRGARSGRAKTSPRKTRPAATTARSGIKG
jgi:AcrR family transcriptional regulator